MFKLLFKLVVLILFYVGLGMFIAGDKTYAAYPCPDGNNKPGDWGINTGPADHGFASLTVRATVAGQPNQAPNVKYRLKSNMPSGPVFPAPSGAGSNYNPDARIFQVDSNSPGVIDTVSRTNDRWFGTGGALGDTGQDQGGDKIYYGPGKDRGFVCPGWDQLGPGNNLQRGNRFVMDCAENDRSGVTWATRFRISDITDPPGSPGRWGGYWTMVLHKYNEDTGRTVTENLGINEAFTVVNGMNARIDMTWHPNPPPNPEPGGGDNGRCERLDVNGWGAYDTGGTNGNPRWRPTQTLVRVTDGSGNLIVPEPGDKKTSNGLYALLEGGPGPPGYNESKTWQYRNKVKTKTITIQIIRKWHKRDGTNYFWYEEINNTNTYTCYNASCKLSITGQNVPGQPQGIQSRSGFSVTSEVHNISTPEAVEPLPALVDGRPLIIANNSNSPVGFWYNPAAPDGIPRNTSEWNTWNVTEPGSSIGNYSVGATLYYDFDPAPGIQGGDLVIANCSPASYEVYKPFQLTPIADVQLNYNGNPYPEDPSEVRYIGSGSGTVPDYPNGIDVNYSSSEQSPSGTANHSGVGRTTVVHNHGNSPSQPVRAGDRYFMNFCIAQANGWIGPGNKFSSDTFGACSSNYKYVHDRPYLRTYGGDVHAGNICSGRAGDIKTYVSPHSTKTGSGNQLGVFAKDSIEEFISASLRYTLGHPRPNTGLTFANTSGTGSFGGRFEAGICPSDYFAGKDNSATNMNPGGLANIKNLSGKYNADGSGSAFTLGNGVGLSGQKAIYVEGNVYINQNISYSGYASIEDIPRLTIIASGDIYIAPGVSRLDGTFVAGGKISTCATSSGSYSDTQLWGSCRTRLTVNGALLAPYIDFLRSYGSLRSSLRSSDGTTRNNAGEVIIYSPELYLAELLGEPSGGGASGQVYQPRTYDAITTLPPIL